MLDRPKAYKDQFKIWGWQKHLPGEVAHWMVDRAADRKATGKKTAFEFGGKRWTLEQAKSSASRTKKDVFEGENILTSFPHPTNQLKW